MAEVTGWNELQKLIFAKRSLKGLAKMFVQSERGITTWLILKKKLKREFEVKVNSAQIHKLLMTRRKKTEESVQEYALVMREIGSRGNVESNVVMQYIIEGIHDDTPNKIILYGAKNFADFKEKLKIYGQMKTTKTYSQDVNFKSKKNGFQTQFRKTNKDWKNKKNLGILCFNCGIKGHTSIDCHDKGKGTKCFSCNGFGHVAKNCPKKQSRSEDVGTSSSATTEVTTIEVIPKNSVKLTVDGVQLIALLDTGSDISAIRNDVYSLYFKDIALDQTFITLRGIGPNKVSTLGCFEKNVFLNDQEVTLKIHVIPTEASNFRCILGTDLLSQVDVHLSDGEVRISRREKEHFLMKITVDAFAENVCIGKEINSGKAKELIDRYEPNKIKTTDVKRKIIMKSEEPECHRPRKLSVPGREEVEKQIEEGLEEEIIRPSSSDFASALVPVKKKDDGKFHRLRKKTMPIEEKYHSYELETRAIIDVVKKFRVYLLGSNVNIITDCAAYQRTIEKKDLTTRVARWTLLLEECIYEIEHRRGKRMMHMDALSRNPIEMTMTKESTMNEDAILDRLQRALNSTMQRSVSTTLFEILTRVNMRNREEIEWSRKANERHDLVKVGDHEGPARTSTCAVYMKLEIYHQSESESDSKSEWPSVGV